MVKGAKANGSRKFLKEVYQRVLITLLLIAYLLEWIDFGSFINTLIVGYYLRLAIIMGYSLWLYTPKIYFSFPANTRQLLTYSTLIFLSAFGASVIIDIDASMLGKLVEDRYVAYYRVAIFIAAVIDAPVRAMLQIVSPLVSEAINKNNSKELKSLLSQSGTNLLLVSGLFFVLINANINDLYDLIYFLSGKEGFAVAIPVVLYISITKIITAATGCTNNIINNSKYFYFVPFLSIGSAIAVVFLNLHFIEELGFIGAAFATLIVITAFNIIKVLIVGMTFKITPFSRETFYLILLITGHYYTFSMIELPFSAFVNLIIKSSLICLLYLACCFGLNISTNINKILTNTYKKLRSILG